MAKFREIVESNKGQKYILQGNTAFALGVIHAGYHTADGYPGTPSTEVIDKALSKVQDKIQVGWSVNEAVAVAVAVGHSIAGFDSLVTMKTPGVFQAGDAITTSAFYTATAGALVLYVASDYDPSSTQHVIDMRHFFSSARIPVLEPRNHQEMYEIAWSASDISKKFNTPVVILASGVLAHSEGLVSLREPRIVEPRELPENMNNWMLMPGIARDNYNKATRVRIPGIRKYIEKSKLVSEGKGDEDFAIIVSGESDIIVREALNILDISPDILSLGITYPIPKDSIMNFCKRVKGKKILIIEDGDRFLENNIRLLGLDVIGKEEYSIITNWNPETVINFLSTNTNIQIKKLKDNIDIKPVKRPPSICPGCPYTAFGVVVDKLKKKKEIFTSFGDIGCSTLLYFNNAIDTVLCMGASDSMRQGFTMSRPEYANKTISVIGDSCECHSGLDSTRNAVFRNNAGVKVILDNSITAMTGGQPAPSSETNLAGESNKFSLKKAVEAEAVRTVTVNSYDLEAVESELSKALKLASDGEFSALILEGPCIHEVENNKKIRRVKINTEKCKKCGLCGICPGIEANKGEYAKFTNLCTNCGSSGSVCMQKCPFGAIEYIEESEDKKFPLPQLTKSYEINKETIKIENLPQSLRLAIRGIGGQGNLFFGKILSEVALLTPYSNEHIVKGDTHGMAQLGGPVISTFSCGTVYSPILAPKSADVLVVMEISEVLRPGFLNLLKPDGTIIFNNFAALPINTKKEDYPSLEDIEKILTGYNVIKIDANKIVGELGDKIGKTANVAVLGLLSTVAPFNKIPEEIWLSALMSLSPTDFLKSSNQLAFKAGKGKS